MRISNSEKKLKVLFVGAFSHTKDGSVGGQLHACKTLIRSEIINKVEFVLIDSTMETLPPPKFIRRAYLALKRILSFLFKISTQSIDTAFIFTSSGSSFIEKGFMSVIASVLRVRTVLSPRSGLLIDDLRKSKIMRGYVKFVLRRCDVVLCQSDNWKHFYQELSQLPSSRFSVIKNWLDPEPYLGIPIKREEKSRLNVLFLGWVEKNKGIYDIVTAVNNHQILGSNFKFIICGKGSELENVKDLVSKYALSDVFDFRGWVTGEDKLAILRKSHILILPSHREGLPNSILEAMASGCCVIASSVGAIPNVIEDKKNGILIDKSDVNQLADALLSLNSSQIRFNMGKKARETICNHHDINTVWRNVFSVLNYQNK